MDNKAVVNDLNMSDAEIASQVKHPSGPQGLAIVAKHNAGNKAMIKKAYELLHPESKRVLEIGFGNGIHFADLVAKYSGLNLTGLELSETMVDDCLKVNQQLIASKRLEVRIGDVLTCDFKAESFDAVISINTIYYWGDTSEAVRKLFDCIKIGGSLVLAFRPKDNIEHVSYIQYGVQHLNFQLYELSELVQLLTATGLIDIYTLRQKDCMVLKDNNGKDIPLESCFVLARKP